MSGIRRDVATGKQTTMFRDRCAQVDTHTLCVGLRHAKRYIRDKYESILEKKKKKKNWHSTASIPSVFSYFRDRREILREIMLR